MYTHFIRRRTTRWFLFFLLLVVGCLSSGCVKKTHIRSKKWSPRASGMYGVHRSHTRRVSKTSSRRKIVRRTKRKKSKSTKVTRRTVRRTIRKPRSLWKLYLPRQRSFRTFAARFKKRRWSFLRSVLERRGLIERDVKRIFRKMRLPWELVLLAGIESSYRNRARSWAGAGGMWQFIPSTARLFGLRRTHWVDERYHPLKSTRAAGRYLKRMQKVFRRWEWTIAAYNCGEGCIRRVLKRCPRMSFWRARRLKRCKIPSETRQYVARFFSVLYFLRYPPRSHGKLELLRPYPLQRLRLSGPVSLPELAYAVGTNVQRIRYWNPELISWSTPPKKRYIVRMPSGLVRKARIWLKKKRRIRLVPKRVRSHRELRRIARRSNLSTHFLRAAHSMRSRRFRSRVVLIPMPIKGTFWHRRNCQHLGHFAKRMVPWSSGLRRLKVRRRRSSRPMCYRVRAGDSLWHVARRYNLRLRTLKMYNRRTRILRKGQWVRLRKGARCSSRRRQISRWVAMSSRKGFANGRLLLYRLPRTPRSRQRVASSRHRVRRKQGRRRKVRRMSPPGRKSWSTRRKKLQKRRIKSRARRQRFALRSKRTRRCYRVRRGDTLWSISRRYGLSSKRLQRLNPRHRRRLKIGALLRLRRGTSC